jgi:dephospho-CoA kinase
VAEIPLLFEGGRSGAFDCTVAVTVPDERRLAWAAERGLDEEALRAIEARQLSGEEKARRADVVVENGADLATLRRRAEELLERVSGGRWPGCGWRNQAG